MNITFKQMDNKKGFSAFIATDKSNQIIQQVNACKNGECNCDCDIEMMSKIKNIETIQNDDGFEIKITGDISHETIAPMMQKCLISNDENISCK